MSGPCDVGSRRRATLPLRTNGGFTTRAGELACRAPRPARVSPAATPAGRRASAIDLPSVGLERAAGDLAVAVRGVHLLVRAQHAARVEQHRPDELRAAGGCATSAALPTKSRGLARSTVHARPDVERRRPSRPCPGRRGSCPASRRSVSRAPSPQGRTPAAASACHSAAARAAGQHDLEAVLAGVAGARDEAASPIARAPWNGFSAARRRLAARRSACQTFARAFGPCTAIIARSSRGVSASAGRARRAMQRAQPRDVLVRRARVDDEAEEVLAQEIDDQVVDHAAVLVAAGTSRAPCRAPAACRRCWRARSAGSRARRRPRGRPRACARRRTCPASRRTAWCSSICEP